ncbi:flagellar hook-length control protein FliK [Poseidonibacter antarcticus]|uniref:flagellar hook-length control protein FliK n=1 Tax=Poseidonibacter antarcticus TaxID=2478538 RepID=UPI000EF4C7E6|nr:flagellar hook-length control protein FliK [Poseidonibacter antarcticus]
MTKQIDILSTLNTGNKDSKTTSTTSNKEVKQEISLFDKLLSGSVSTLEKIDSGIRKENINIKEVTVDIDEKINNKDSIKIDNKDTENSNRNTSLLNRLVLESKKISIDNNSLEDTKIDNKLNTIEKDTIEEKIDSGIRKENINIKEVTVDIDEKINNKDSIKIDNKDTENSNRNTSLLNRLVLESKKISIDNNSLEDTKIDNKLNTIEKDTIEEKIDSGIRKENINIKEVTVNTDEILTIDDSKSIGVDTIKNEDNTKIIDASKIIKLDNKLNEVLVEKNTKTIEVKDIIVEDIKAKQTVQSSDDTILKNNELKNTELKIDTKVILENNINELSKKEEIITTVKTDTKTTQISEIINSNNKIENINIDDQNLAGTKNNKLAKDLAILNDNNKNERINISREEPKSLMDSLIDKTKIVKDQMIINEDDSKILQNSDVINKQNNSKNMLNNIYLGSLKNSMNTSALSNKTEAINSVKDATTIQEIEVNANKLDLNVKDISVGLKENEIKKDTLDLTDRKSTLDKLILNKNAIHNEVNNVLTKSIEASKVVLDDFVNEQNDDVSLNVNTSLANNIQTRIIGARQQMSSMMSDVARKMYENYKPPITAFRINLNPATLGHIGITMKSDKDNSINISLNISNHATLDSFIDNQSSLRNALNKTFNDTAEFNLDFSSSDQSNGNSNNQEDSDKSFTNESNTQTILESREKNLESEDRNIDYM